MQANYLKKKCKGDYLPYICDYNDVLTVPLVAEKVWKANFEGQIIKCVILHFNRLKISIASIMRF